MKPGFADTSYFVALLSPRDVNHERACALGSRFHGPLVTSEYVIVEVGNFFTPPRVREKLRDFMAAVESDPRTTIVPASSSLLNRAIELFVSRRDKSWSLTDCTSFVIMADHGIDEALTADRHFEQAGFSAQLLPDK